MGLGGRLPLLVKLIGIPVAVVSTGCGGGGGWGGAEGTEYESYADPFWKSFEDDEYMVWWRERERARARERDRCFQV